MKKAFIFILFISTSIAFSQQKYQSLLWEITGNGLKKPSYLYGTMHVSKKVAFRLDDVFYKALNASDAIALESDPSTWPASNYDLVLNEMSRYNPYSSNFYTDLFKLTHPLKMAIRGSVRMDNGIINSYLYRKNNASDNFEEETYLDMFIFQAGKKRGKEIIALEDLEESHYLTTKAAYNVENKKIAPWLQKLFAKENPYLLQENLYRDRNLDLLDSIGAASNTPFYRENMLYIRNENMVIVLEKAMKEKSIFAGVGAAHLPGNKGMINMLRKRGFTLKPLISKQTSYSKAEKNKLDSLFLEPKLQLHSTPDGFLTMNSYDTLREFSFAGQKYYLDPDMTNGAYITINRVSRFLYLPNEKEHITLKDIDHLLYEDIPGDIIKKETLTQPYPGISILNKTKKGEFQKYHIYQTPLEIIIIKFAGKSDFAFKHETKVFNSIVLKEETNSLKSLIGPNNAFEVNFPEYFISNNLENKGAKLLQGYRDNAYYFLQEAALNDVNYIEEDSFEAKYFHHAFYNNYKLTEIKGSFKRGDYKTYESEANLKTSSDKKMYLKTIVKNGRYYLLGYVGTNENDKNDYFNSFKFRKLEYSNFKKVRDTSLHFSVYTNAKMPEPNPYAYDRKLKKQYLKSSKKARYTTNTNEDIFIKRTKFHDLQMFHNIDSLWNDIEQNINTKDYRHYAPDGNFTTTHYVVKDRSKSKVGDTYYYQFSYMDSNSVKKVMVKNILKQGVLFELRTLIDTLSGPSQFVAEFYDSFTPKDTLLGKAVLEDKTRDFFKALKNKDSIVLESYDFIKFKPKHSKVIVDVLKNHEFDKERLHIKTHLVKELIKVDLKNNISFIKDLYYKSYSNPETQTGILEALLDSNNSDNYTIASELMERDLPLDNVNQIFYNYKKDSLALKASLFPKILQYTTIEEYKQPLYDLLAKVKDSGYVDTKSISFYKNQIINDGKIEVKRSLSNPHSKYGYNSYSTSKDLSTYVSLIFPYRKEQSVKDFFEKLLNVDDKNALVKYYTLLVKHKETIPESLKEKVLNNEDNQYLLIEELDHAKLLKSFKNHPITQKQYAKSKLLSQARIKKEKDSISFIKKQDFTTDKGKTAEIYFFKINKKDEYLGKIEELHYIAFLKSKDKSLVVKPYYISNNAGLIIDETKTLEEQLTEVINLATFKDRKRLKPLSRGGYDY